MNEPQVWRSQLRTTGIALANANDEGLGLATFRIAHSVGIADLDMAPLDPREALVPARVTPGLV
jgi:hypothetical protein